MNVTKKSLPALLMIHKPWLAIGVILAMAVVIFTYKYLTKPVLRARPTKLSVVNVQNIIKKHDFFAEYDNPYGKGFDNDFGLQKDSLVVYDLNSNLMWQQSGSDTSMEFEKAKQWITELNDKRFAGFNDWRLPTLEEAMSLMEPEKKSDLLIDPRIEEAMNEMEPEIKKGLYIDPIFNSKQVWIWTADQVKGSSSAWIVNFYLGVCDPYYTINSYVRAVRSGQPNESD